jgi:hypothetical protein
MVDMQELEAVLASNPRALEILKAEGIEEIMRKVHRLNRLLYMSCHRSGLQRTGP